MLMPRRVVPKYGFNPWNILDHFSSDSSQRKVISLMRGKVESELPNDVLVVLGRSSQHETY